MATMAQAIRLALHYGEEYLGVKDVFGEDVGPPLGGVFTCTQGIKTAWNSPLDERGIIGCALGLALVGQKPVAEIQFCDYIFNTIDLLKYAGSTLWRSNGQWPVAMVIMTPVGSGIHGAVYHSHSFESVMSHIQGWKIVMPSNAYDAYGLMLAAIKDPNPVMVLMPKALLRSQGEEKIPGEPADAKELSKMIDAPLGDRSQWRPKWPNLKDPNLEIGKAKLCLEGEHLSVISYGRTLPLCLQAAQELSSDGISCEVIDLRTIYPYDQEMIFASVQKTGRVIVVNEDTEVTNFGEHILRRITEDCFYHLQAPPTLLAGANIPGVGLAENLEQASIPQLETIIETLKAVARTS
ncbi:MAG: 3-methyl-2-oxobutanoate dehydrogenase [Deltaproteobacteria bacterium RIFCSPLOWO2_01_44_7]|nr:MAG: 3-methyl-2-oxobutanoate dehydrogenase [Deltaproteobacteria bacterium RIFCSPHIGHO2_01_FULL_43_49]OGQ15424.1 MAG: 3-methyl-2-oxobutanoate dehydrogenase [Deltaproteobacteria bacterium RIFCSPHIGHO2_02_FULL_44_53]OGQ29617.1 MAG: 3-methyl-2-oxobutanoate dehydrogenase [Deltaproteobacteria bacterium RIFCSPHIGHO2_12_FULL_44_21]OGQ32230.1 MAG: 3-methyl-2-oxobutanoate dehydrogenase [Deltaproteobacteria bacterium RIFCSPLOWO2_01_FULL_45_74]OGQ41310.1 MAG: 3-methyl-2-oxobutanoate dehydrogenase [Delta